MSVADAWINAIIQGSQVAATNAYDALIKQIIEFETNRSGALFAARAQTEAAIHQEKIRRERMIVP